MRKKKRRPPRRLLGVNRTEKRPEERATDAGTSVLKTHEIEGNKGVTKTLNPARGTGHSEGNQRFIRKSHFQNHERRGGIGEAQEEKDYWVDNRFFTTKRGR